MSNANQAYLEQCFNNGTAEADAHFKLLIEAARQSLPSELHAFIPAARSDIGGCFVSSTTRCNISVVRDMRGFADIEATFSYQIEQGWQMQGYVMLTSGFLGMPQQVRIEKFSDAILISQYIKEEELNQKKTAATSTRVN